MRVIKCLIFAAVLAVLAVFVSGFGAKEYRVVDEHHVVSDGQTVWGIATKYFPRQNKYRDIRYLVDDIGKVNHLPERNWNIRPGDELIIPLLVEIKKGE
nr:MAG TPA_asm: cell division suppressor protein [Caudoviricetes sp.]